MDRALRSGESRTQTQRPALGEGGANKSILRRNRSADDNGPFARARSIAGTRIAIHKMANAAKNTTVRTLPKLLVDRSIRTLLCTTAQLVDFRSSRLGSLFATARNNQR